MRRRRGRGFRGALWDGKRGGGERDDGWDDTII